MNAEATRRLVEAIREDIRAIHTEGERRHQELLAESERRHRELLAEGERHRQELLTFLRDMDRRHTEILAEIGKRV